MITKPTVLILGAGASMPFGFPNGLQLKAEICREIKKMQGAICRDLELFTDNKKDVKIFCENLLLSSEMSIDAFLYHNPEYCSIGQRAIANILLRKEKRVKLFDEWIDKWLDPENKDKHWYQLLFSKLDAAFDNFEENQLKIITFNYDRSLEYFLLNAMLAKYSKQDPDKVLGKLRQIPILHVYGKLGNLPEYDSEPPFVRYDLFADSKPRDQWAGYVYEASQKIVTIHRAEELNNFSKAREFLLEAERIYFLGFGYDMTNMERLFIDRIGDANRNLLKTISSKCAGTAMGLSPHHRKLLIDFGLSGMLSDLYLKRQRKPNPLIFPDCTIYDFLQYNENSKLD